MFVLVNRRGGVLGFFIEIGLLEESRSFFGGKGYGWLVEDD